MTVIYHLENVNYNIRGEGTQSISYHRTFEGALQAAWEYVASKKGKDAEFKEDEYRSRIEYKSFYGGYAMGIEIRPIEVNH